MLTLSFTNSPDSLAMEQATRAWGLNDPDANKIIEDVDYQRIEYLYQLMLTTGLAELVALQYARLLYYTRVGLYAQATVPALDERMLVIHSLLAIVEEQVSLSI